MSWFHRALVLLVAALAGLAHAECKGKFPNPITDYCWSCMFPISMSGGRVFVKDQEDTDNPDKVVCACGMPPRIGVPVSFWEPARLVDITRTPGCLVALGGIEVDLGFNAPVPARFLKEQGEMDYSEKAFYHANWYINPILTWTGAILDSDCLELKGFDLAYTTALDPLWSDDELTALINWDAALFANPIAQGVCAADCVAATTGFPSNTLFWCAGCQGGLYPLNGITTTWGGGVQNSALLVQRMTAKLHREGVMWGTWGEQGLCGNYPQLLMNKQAYKMTMVYPIPQTAKIDGRCCQPYGRTTVLWGAGKEFPVEGEDFSYQIYRKRNCCQGAIGAGS
jgi:conjugal transfer pilus assembly protein TraU